MAPAASGSEFVFRIWYPAACLSSPTFKSTTLPKKQANPIDGQVGNRLRLRRMMIGMSQEKLGELLGLTFQQVQKYEKGVNRIGAGRLFEIARILGVPIQYFYESVTEQLASTPGFAERDSQPVLEFVSSGDGLQLSLAYMRIKDPKVRKRVLDLVKSLAEDTSESAK
jgi:transcriptional regulator with XRE-family HTH domain